MAITLLHSPMRSGMTSRLMVDMPRYVEVQPRPRRTFIALNPVTFPPPPSPDPSWVPIRVDRAITTVVPADDITDKRPIRRFSYKDRPAAKLRRKSLRRIKMSCIDAAHESQSKMLRDAMGYGRIQREENPSGQLLNYLHSAT